MPNVLADVFVSRGFNIWDYGVLIAYLVATLCIGMLVGRKRKSFDEYCLAGRSIPWWAACVSIVATDLSGISYMGVPAWLYHHDLKYNTGVLLMPLVMFAVLVIFIPVFYRIGVYTIYHYLETRFHTQARTVTAGLFLVKGFIHLAGAIYIPALAMAAVTNIPLWICVLIIGLTTTAYTMKGGMHAVIWTDLMQFIVLLGGLILMIAIAMSELHWDWLGVWKTAGSLTASATGTPHTKMIDWTLDFKTEATVWSILAFYFIFNLGTYGTDQVAVQRYLTMGSYKEVLKSILGASLVTIFSVALMAALGLILVVYYHHHAGLAQTLDKADMVLPHFVMNALPTGTRGVIFAAIVAATMSCVSAGLNSFSTVGAVDLYSKLTHKTLQGANAVYIAKLFTFLSGLVTTGMALWLSLAQTTIIETVNSLISITLPPITAMFLLGILTKRANFPGLMVGVVAGLIVGGLIQWGPLAHQVNWMWIAPIGCVTTYLAGYIASLLIPYQRVVPGLIENNEATASTRVG